MRLVVKTLFGLEEVLAQEIKDLGGKDIEVSKRAVAFYGNKRLLYKANLHLRTGLRVLQSVYSFKAFSEKDLYEKAMAFNWSSYMSVDQTFAIDATVFSKNFTHSKYASLKVKDALCDYFRKECGERPNVDASNPDVRFNVYIAGTEVIISFDSSGDSLHKRGYRNHNHKAPLNEVLAAGMIKLAGWTPDMPLYDPMCGSGTLLIEAAMMGRNIPAGICREKFGFMSWTNFDKELWEEVVEEGKAGITDTKMKIFGSDMSALSIDIAKESTIMTKVNGDIDLKRRSFERLKPAIKNGIMITNPPYGERLKTDDILLFYKMIGNKLKEQWIDFDVWIISSNMDAFKKVHLRVDEKHELHNGALECEFRKYHMYLDDEAIDTIE